MSIFNKNSKSDANSGDKSTPPNSGTDKKTLGDSIKSLFDKGNSRTENGSPVGIVDDTGKKNKPGFLPNSSYGDDWVGNLLDAHPKSLNSSKLKTISTSDRFNESRNRTADEPYSTRDYYLLFNDPTTDYFKHGLQIIDNKNPIQDTNGIYSWNGNLENGPIGNVNTSNENNDPVIYGFEFVVDAISSPLLNGSVEDFIDRFSSISEIASKKIVIQDFKQQFQKLFKTKGTIKITPVDGVLASSVPNNYANTDIQGDIIRSGAKAYLAYYLKKVSGLSKLAEGNATDSYSYITDYGKDKITLSFNEDVSLTLGTLAHLYKLLYWSKPNGKSLVPENLLRFNCDIIISECRQFNRVRKSISNGGFDILKDNLSRYVYSLKECQFYFKAMTHEDSVDIGGGNLQTQDNYDVEFDYKYSSVRFEKWVHNDNNFGQYVNYDGGAIWKVGNLPKRTRDTENIDLSKPAFKTTKNKTEITLDNIDRSTLKNEVNTITKDGDVKLSSIKNPQSDTDTTQGIEKSKFKKSLGGLKDRSGKATKALFNNLEKTAKNEVKRQLDIRLQLLNASISKALNSVGMGTISAPTNIYTQPFGMKGNPQVFYDVQKNLKTFLGDSLGGQLGNVAKGGKINTSVNNIFKGKI